MVGILAILKNGMMITLQVYSVGSFEGYQQHHYHAGVGDTPLWASSPIGRTVFQFRSFTTASYNRATIGGLSEGTAQFYYGTAFQIALGALTYALKQAANGKEVDWSPQKLALEGIDRSGILGPLMEYNNMAEKASGGMFGLGRCSAPVRNPVTPAAALSVLRWGQPSACWIPLPM
jgi:hypothetical protein